MIIPIPRYLSAVLATFAIVLLALPMANAAIAVPAPVATSTVSVPHLVKFSGSVPNTTGTVGITFAIYKDQQGGAPLWLETQNVRPDSNGHYTVYLGANHPEGVPVELFTSTDARWLGVQPEGQPEQTRVLFVNVPYALKAGDAETLGGLPVSAFVLNTAAVSTGTQASAAQAITLGSGSPTPAATSIGINITGTKNQVAKFTDDSIGDSRITDTTVGVGIGNTNPESLFQVGGTSGQWSKFNPQAWGLRIGSLQSGTQYISMGAMKHGADNAYYARTGSTTVAHSIMEFQYDGGLKYRQQAHVADGATLTGLSSTFVISGNGNVGVGMETPKAKLDVGGDVRINSGNFFVSTGNITLGEGTISLEGKGAGIHMPDGSFFDRAPRDGYDGYDGEQGPEGEMGPMGPQGPQGDPGPQGEPGIPGLVAKGAWSPIATYSLNDVVTWDGSTYRCKSEKDCPMSFMPTTNPELWEVLAAKGDTGETGAQGPQGEVGPMGPQGETGATGAQGPQGLIGPRGVPGPKGDPGVSQVHVLSGPISGPIAGLSGQFVQVGPAFNVTTTITERLSAVGTAVIGLQTGTTPQTFVLDFCYENQDTGVISNFAAGNYVEPMITDVRSPFFASASVRPGAGSWRVYMCAVNYGSADIDVTDYVNGWVMVSNDASGEQQIPIKD